MRTPRVDRYSEGSLICTIDNSMKRVILAVAALAAAAPLAAHNGVPHDQGLAPETIR